MKLCMNIPVLRRICVGNVLLCVCMFKNIVHIRSGTRIGIIRISLRKKCCKCYFVI